MFIIGGSHARPKLPHTEGANKVFRLPKTLFIQGVCFYCTGSLLVGVKSEHLILYFLKSFNQTRGWIFRRRTVHRRTVRRKKNQFRLD